MPRKRPKSLDANVVRLAREMEKWAYMRCDQWKSKYRYTLVNEFRVCISSAKDLIIEGFEAPITMPDFKLDRYVFALVELAKAEGKMDLMIDSDINVMSHKEWAEAAIMLDNIRQDLSRLVNSQKKNNGGSDFPDFGKGSVPTGHKDA